MGLFGNDDEQDARLDALESHVRNLSDVSQRTQLDVATLTVKLIGLQAQVDDKLSPDDFDPSIIALNDQLATARRELEKTSAAASDSWSTLHAGASDALNTLRNSVDEASNELQQKLSS